jgi:hypothetical protein
VGQHRRDRGRDPNSSAVRRVRIPKKNRKTRTLGLPSWTDKLVGEVIRLLLEAYYGPQLSAIPPGRTVSVPDGAATRH